MIEIMLYIIVIFIIYRVMTRKERKRRRVKRLNKFAWTIAKHKLRKEQRDGKLDPSIDLDSIKAEDIFTD